MLQLFWIIFATIFIAEMGDKTQLLMVAMTSRFKMRQIILGSALSILALNALAVAAGAVISAVIPSWLIKLIAAAAFFYFAWSSMKGDDDDEENGGEKVGRFPTFTVFATFFIAEFGDKTQLTAITFAANEGFQNAILVWLACSLGLFSADVVGMLVGHVIKKVAPEGFLDKLAFVIFAVFGFITMHDGVYLLLETRSQENKCLAWGCAIVSAILFSSVCILTFLLRRKKSETKEEMKE